MNLDNVSELEEYRIEALSELKKSLPGIKKIAEEALSCKVYKIIPTGPITDPAKFTENSDVDIAVYTKPNSNYLNEEMTGTLQSELVDYTFGSFGTVNCIVFS
jgi:predicted nucleotidyltransferase